jgi:hypothetical protein
MESQEMKHQVAPPAVVRLNFLAMSTERRVELDARGNTVVVCDGRMAVEVIDADGVGITTGSIAEVGFWLKGLGYRYVTGTNGMWTTAPEPEGRSH